MPRVKIRALCLTLFAFAAFAPTANAAVADHIIPLYDADDGVRVVRSATGEVKLRFERKAAKLYKTIAGRTAEVGCGTVTPEELGDGPYATSGFSTNPGAKLPRKRGTVRMWTGEADTELCFIATKRKKADRVCLPADTTSKLCLRVIVAVKPSGTAYIDAKARTIELSLGMLTAGTAETPGLTVPGATLLEKMRAMLGPNVVELTTPDDSPPVGQLGYWTDFKDVAVVVLLADGTRRFVRIQDGVYSTNDMELTGLASDDVFTLF